MFRAGTGVQIWESNRAIINQGRNDSYFDCVHLKKDPLHQVRSIHGRHQEIFEESDTILSLECSFCAPNVL